MSDHPPTEALLERTVAELGSRRRFPESTYRLQFHAGFTFRDALGIVPYLHDLGITHCYASPYLKSRPGSLHGYDITDHRSLNPEIGSPEDYDAWVAALHGHGMNQVLDVVPNHMGVVGGTNPWWNDVLENGLSSPYATTFDIDWYSVKPQLHEKVLLPVLGGPYGQVLEAGELQLSFDTGAYALHYFDHRFPIDPATYGQVLGFRKTELEQQLGPTDEALIEYQSILTAIQHLPPSTVAEPARVAERQREKEVVKRRLNVLAAESPAIRGFIAENLVLFNGQPGNSQSFDRLDQLLGVQPYRLCFWRVATDEINYRRFFDVNELAALSMEKPEVFAATHELVLRLLAEGKVSGLRIDHPDGLFDPQEYLERLQQHYFLAVARRVAEREALPWADLEGPLRERLRTATPDEHEGLLRRPLYVVVEKILGKGESLPNEWPVHGTTGYEYLNVLNGLFVATENVLPLNHTYNRWTGLEESYRDIVYQKKFLILQVSLSSELHVLAHQLDRLSEKNRWSRDFTLNSLRHALREVIACFPVYRSYIRAGQVPPRDRTYVQTAVARAKRKNPAISGSLFDFVRDMILLRYPDSATEEDRAEQRRFAGKFQQVTGPVMAKGLEDTSFYVYNRLVSLNDVGGDPQQFGISVESFHRHNQDRQGRWPRALSATSTHDTKRSEDVRARIDVLSELPQEWQSCLARWNRLNKRLRVQWEDAWAPDSNDEYLLYQTLLGVWPIEPLSAEERTVFVERIQAYMQKAIHEAKVHSSWINPDPEYDAAVRQFVAGVLDERENVAFLSELAAFQGRISHYGCFNSLSQVLLKMASPGVPDIYQGCDLWDFSLVDPDNRRPVDYERRRRLLAELRDEAADEGRLPDLCRRLTAAKEDGRIKLYVTWKGLQCRREHPGLFAEGDYLPTEAAGAWRECVCTFARRRGDRWALAVAPRMLTRLVSGAARAPVGAEVWQDTVVLLPEIEAGRTLRNLFTGAELTAIDWKGHAALPLAEVFAHFPVALLLGGGNVS